LCFTEYQLDCLDLYLVELGPRIVNRRNRTLIPIVRERDALVSTLTKLYDQIGLEPKGDTRSRARPVHVGDSKSAA